MPEDDSSSSGNGNTSGTVADHHERRRGWLERLSSAISGDPTSRDDLVELLRDAKADGLIEADTLRMMEGAIAGRHDRGRRHGAALADGLVPVEARFMT